MKIRSIIVDDNEFMAEVLSDLILENHPEIEVMGIAHSGKEGIQKINQLKPNLVFLDIEMPDMSGFLMLSQLGAINFQTIFTTAHSHYAIKAIRFNALDYLVKPIDEKELSESIKRLKNEFEIFKNKNKVQNALLNLKEENVENQKLFLQTQKGTLRITLKNIVRIEGDRNYSIIYLKNNTKKLSSKTLGYFEEILSDKGFFRCHRSHLINKTHVDSINNQGCFLLNNKESIPVSRRKMNDARTWFYE